MGNAEVYIGGRPKSELLRQVLASIPPDAEKETDVSYIARKYLDVPFSAVPGSKKLDIYLPDEGSGPFPVLIYFFGGGFLTGDKRGVQVTIPLLARSLGFAVVGVDYTKSSEGEYPKLVYDAKASIRYLRANAESYGLDPERFIAVGASSGGTLAALLGTSGGVAELEGLSYGNSGQSSRVQGVVDFCGATDFPALERQMEQHVAATGVVQTTSFGRPESPDSLLFDALPGDVPEKALALSPVTHVGPDAPPFLIMHGGRDETLPPQQSIELAKLIWEEAGEGKAELHIIEGAGHCDEAFLQGAIPLMLSFVAKYL